MYVFCNDTVPECDPLYCDGVTVVFWKQIDICIFTSLGYCNVHLSCKTVSVHLKSLNHTILGHNVML